ncbi:hydrolase 1, exosortase A system-associated [Duganella aceris]|nr:hydrolase 1, exosortase A system-associated [Duganella aceris]
MSQARVLHFRCRDCWLFGILELPDLRAPARRGVLIVTGGPQYRVGSHRQFVLLSRHLAANGNPALRFDYRGMGDSEGEMRDFESVQDDLAAAVHQFFAALPAMREVVLWGLCDGATAAAFHATRDRRITGLVLLNPWVRTDQSLARATLRHYYAQRLKDREFWRKLAGGGFGVRRAFNGVGQLIAAARAPAAQVETLPQRLYQALSDFRGQVLVILSGADIGAREFQALAARHAHWRALMEAPRVRQTVIPQANHTFARKSWRDQVAAICADWVRSW